MILLVAAAIAGLWIYRRRSAAVPETASPHEGGKRAPTPAPAPTYFGFTPSEVLVIGGALATAIIAGLFLGGLFS